MSAKNSNEMDDLHAVQVARGGDGVDVHDVDADAREVRLHLGEIPAGGLDRVEQHVVGSGIAAQGDERPVGIAVEPEYRGGGTARDVHVDLVIDEFGVGARFRERADLQFVPGFRRLLLHERPEWFGLLRDPDRRHRRGGLAREICGGLDPAHDEDGEDDRGDDGRFGKQACPQFSLGDEPDR